MLLRPHSTKQTGDSSLKWRYVTETTFMKYSVHLYIRLIIVYVLLYQIIQRNKDDNISWNSSACAKRMWLMWLVLSQRNKTTHLDNFVRKLRSTPLPPAGLRNSRRLPIFGSKYNPEVVVRGHKYKCLPVNNGDILFQCFSCSLGEYSDPVWLYYLKYHSNHRRRIPPIHS